MDSFHIHLQLNNLKLNHLLCTRVAVDEDEVDIPMIQKPANDAD